MRTSEKFKLARGKGEKRVMHEYQVNMWHPDKATLNLAWLVKMAGEPLIATVMQVDSLTELLDSKLDAEMIVPAVRSLMLKLDEREIVNKVRSFTEEMLCDGKKVDFDTHFLGYPAHLMKVVFFVLKAQYSDFFDEPLGSLE